MGYIKKYSEWNTALCAIKESRDNAKALDSILNEQLKQEDFGKKLSGKEKRQAKRAKKKEGKAQKRAWKETEKRDVARFDDIGNSEELKMIKQKDNDPGKDSFKVVSQSKDTEFWGDDGKIKDHIFAWIANQVYNLAAKKNIVPDVSDPNERKEEALKLEAAVNVTKAKKGMLKDKIKFSVDWGDVEGLFYDEKDKFKKGKKKKKGKGDDDQEADITKEKDDIDKFDGIVNKYRSHPEETLPLVKEMIKVRFAETPAVANRPGYHEMDDEEKFKELIMGLQKGFEADNYGWDDEEWGTLTEDLVDHIHAYETIVEEQPDHDVATLGGFSLDWGDDPPPDEEGKKGIVDIINNKGLIEGWEEAGLPPIPENWVNRPELNYEKPEVRSDEEYKEIEDSLYKAIGKQKMAAEGLGDKKAFWSKEKALDEWSKKMEKKYGESNGVWELYWYYMEPLIGKDGKIDFNAVNQEARIQGILPEVFWDDVEKKDGTKTKRLKGLKGMKFADSNYDWFRNWVDKNTGALTDEQIEKYDTWIGSPDTHTGEGWLKDNEKNAYFNWTLFGPKFIADMIGGTGPAVASLESKSILSFNEFNNLNEEFDIAAARQYWTPVSRKDAEKSSDTLSFSDIEKEGFKTQNEGDLFRDWVNKEGNEEIKKRVDKAIEDKLGKTDGLSEGGKDHSYDGDYIKAAWEEVGQEYIDEIQPADPIVADEEEEEIKIDYDYIEKELVELRKEMVDGSFSDVDDRKKKLRRIKEIEKTLAERKDKEETTKDDQDKSKADLPTEENLIADLLLPTLAHAKKKELYDKYNMSDEQKKHFMKWWTQVVKGYDHKAKKYSGTNKDFSGKLDPPFVYNKPKEKEESKTTKVADEYGSGMQNIVVIHPSEKDMYEKVTVNDKRKNRGLRAIIDPKQQVTLYGDRIFGYKKRVLTTTDCTAAGGEWSHYWSDDEELAAKTDNLTYDGKTTGSNTPNANHKDAYCMIKGDPDKKELVIGNYEVKTGIDIQDLRDKKFFNTKDPIRFISSKDLVRVGTSWDYPEKKALTAALEKMKDFTAKYKLMHAGQIKDIIAQKDTGRKMPKVDAKNTEANPTEHKLKKQMELEADGVLMKNLI